MNNGKKGYEWRLDALYNGIDDPRINSDLARIRNNILAFVDKWEKNTEFTHKPEVLAQALKELDDLTVTHGLEGRPGYYLSLLQFLDQNDPKIKASLNKLNEFGIELSNKIQFFSHRISRIPLEEQNKFLESPLLSQYKNYLKGHFDSAKYLLSEEAEKIITLKSATSYANWVKMVSDFLSREEGMVLNEQGIEEKKSFSEIAHLLNDQNKKVRDSAAKVFNEILEKHSDVSEYEINSILQDKKLEDDLRHVERPDTLRHLADEMDTDVIDTLIKTVNESTHVSKRFYELKAKLFGVEKLLYHERNVEYGNLDKTYSFETALEVAHKIFTKLDPEFEQIFSQYINDGCVDAFPRKGKMGGACCTVKPFKNAQCYILLNYGDKIRDVLTLAHEMGHGIHEKLAADHNNGLNFSTSTSLAEVASIFMEDFALEELVANETDEEKKLEILMMKLNNDISSVQRQAACYTFEQDLHNSFKEKGFLSKKDIGEIFSKHMFSYMGDYVEKSQGSENWWIYWEHIRSYFYVYSYVSGTLVSKSLQNLVRKDPSQISKVKGFMKAGSSKSPKEIFLDMGIDISSKDFWKLGLSEIEYNLNEAWRIAKDLKKLQ